MRKVSGSTVGRLSLYLRRLAELAAAGVETFSSEELAARCQTSAAQVRKDLSFFGAFGKRGRGYVVTDLLVELRRILGLERRWRVGLVGAGKIGAALFAHRDFADQGFDIVAVYDSDPAKVGTVWNGVVVQPVAELGGVRGAGIEIAIVAVPAEAAQEVVDRVVAGGIRAILNFASSPLKVPPGVTIRTVNMALELESLSYALANEARGARTIRSRPAASRG
jgi:redox-sensing transcriptional repressor